MGIPSVGEHIVATVNDAKQFGSNRQFAVWIGGVPRQYSTGGHVHLGRTSKNTFALCLYTVQELSLPAVKKRLIETAYGYKAR